MADVFEQRRDLDVQRERLWELIEETPWLDWLLLTKRPGPALRMVPWRGAWPANVWFGATVEDADWARKRLPHLLRSAAVVRFVSCEPLLGAVDLSACLGRGAGKVNWVIAGGESGGNSRPSDPAWLRALRDQCAVAEVPFHFKQWGNWRPSAAARAKRRLPVTDGLVERVSKKLAGRRLDGRTWDQFPASEMRSRTTG
jgi:protein gp37